ncbi:hypothetical protein Bhyg_03220 [Pseudolycoriella hygida]|uniref:Uncharacterized protein n=1 Tax=Pseudolycoriella hygida TaxID=35572 RepID=A0A9Q0S9B2_9DIPT|nr:hypothetical protein Bhyg_03220 [Pseudolycoriella hygida]
MESFKRGSSNISVPSGSKRSKTVDILSDEILVESFENPQTDMETTFQTQSEEDQLRKVLEDWSAVGLFEELKRRNITIKNLHKLEDADYMELIKNDDTLHAQLLDFRLNHRQWKSFSNVYYADPLPGKRAPTAACYTEDITKCGN